MYPMNYQQQVASPMQVAGNPQAQMQQAMKKPKPQPQPGQPMQPPTHPPQMQPQHPQPAAPQPGQAPLRPPMPMPMQQTMFRGVNPMQGAIRAPSMPFGQFPQQAGMQFNPLAAQYMASPPKPRSY